MNGVERIAINTNHFETAIDLLADRYRQKPNLNATHAQGYLAETLVALQLGDQERINPMLDTWRQAQLGTGIKEKAAANNPDWLIIDPDGRITTIVEVKAVASDRPTIADQINDYVAAWGEVGQLTRGINQESWRNRIAKAWPTNSQKFAKQLAMHGDRLGELVHAGVLQVADSLTTVLFVPQGQDYSDVPPQIKLKDQTGQIIDVPLTVERLPSLDQLKMFINQARVKTGIAVTETTVDQEKRPASAADTVRARKEKMLKHFDSLTKLLGTTSLDELNMLIGKLIVGEARISHQERRSLFVEASDLDTILNALGSTHPCLAAHLVFSATGGRLPGPSKLDRNAFKDLGADLGIELSEDITENLLRAVIDARIKLTNKGYRLPTLTQNCQVVQGEISQG